jgi:hypothetical protein
VTHYPLAFDRRNWPAAAREFWAERAAIVEVDRRCTRDEADRIAEVITRSWWLAGGDEAFLGRAAEAR